MAGELGKASLDLEARLGDFEKNIEEAKSSSDGLKHALEAVAAIADVAQKALKDVRMAPGQGAESRLSAEGILSGVRGISEEARTAARELDHVKLTEAQGAESEASASIIDRALNSIGRNADQAKRKLAEVRLASHGGGLGGVGLGSAALGAGALAAPAAVPGALGLLAGIPALAAGGAGALGTLMLAFQGVGKAIGGDKKAFDGLTASQQQFVLTVRSLDGWFRQLKQTAGNALFPGLTEGLRAALSPGTVGAITKAITQFGHALGMAGAQWGRFFGSREFQSIFGPLMQSAARNIGVLSDAFLHLFDALGVVARAAIPLVNWMTDAIDKGARLADTWIHAQAASGALARGMSAAERSLTLVGKAFGALLDVVGALGRALYPVSNVALQDITAGLDGLAGVIRRNQGLIRDLVGGALKVLVVAVKAAADGIGVVVHTLERLVGEKAVVVAAITAIGAILLATLGPYSLAIGGAIVAIGLIKDHWKTVERFFLSLGHEIVNAFEYAWYLLEKGALVAALKIVEPFSHLPAFLGGWARKAKDSMQAQLDQLQPPNMAWGAYAEKAGAYDGIAWKKGFLSGVAGAIQNAFNAVGQAVHDATHPHHKKRRPSSTDPALPPAPTPDPKVFGTPPPFTKNTGGTTHHRKHRLSAAQRMQERLQYALDLAKLAVENARQGSKAWDRAIAAEKVALRAEVRYWDARAKNDKLSMKLRDAALRKELEYEKQLKALTKQVTPPGVQSALANEAQFLKSFVDIQNAFAPNAVPYAPAAGKTNTHLHEIKNELRQQTPLLRKAAERARFPGSAASAAAALAIGV